MPNKPKTQTTRDRKAKLEELRKAQKAKERRQTTLVVGIAAVVGLALIAAAAVPLYNSWRNDPARQSYASFGVSLAEAACDPVQSEAASGTGQHVPNGQVVSYATVPPTYGEHYDTPAPFGRKFYGVDDRPPVEQLVHNLEHGYNVLWYTDALPADQVEDLRSLAEKIGNDEEGNPNFVASAWDPAYGEFPQGKTVALAHWGAEQGHRQLCGQLSGEAVETFVQQYPKSDSPEPLGA